MRKAKVIIIVSLTAVMLAIMTMPAVNATFEMDIKPDGTIPLAPESYVPTTVYLTGMNCDGSSHTLNVTVKMGTPEDLTFYVTDLETGATEGPEVGGITYTYTPSAGTMEYDIQVEIMAKAGTEGNDYGVYYQDVQSGRTRIASASVRTTSIPEFTTIAVPVAAMLGLLFFFNYRKRQSGR